MLAASSPIAASFVDWISCAWVRLSSAICCLTPSYRREFSAATPAWSAMPPARRRPSGLDRGRSLSPAIADPPIVSPFQRIGRDGRDGRGGGRGSGGAERGGGE